jgi:hypothetical protein
MPTLVPEVSAHPLPQRVWPMMSVLVHDLRQPLSVIDACADYLNLILPVTDRRARQQLDLLQQQVGEANRILHEALVQLHYTDAPSQPEEPGAGSRSFTKAAGASVTY